MEKTYCIITFGCAQNEADSERIASYYVSRGYKKAESYKDATDVVINTCMIRQMAEDRVYGLIRNIQKQRDAGKNIKIILTGCMVGMATRDASGRLLKTLQKRVPQVDEFLPIEEVGFDHGPLRNTTRSALIPVTNGCNNFCSYCVVPFSRGRERSRPVGTILDEVQEAVRQGLGHIMLLGQNVNSYGADLVLRNKYSPRQTRTRYQDGKKTKGIRKDRETISGKDDERRLRTHFLEGKPVRPTYVKHLGRNRIPTLFPYLLERVSSVLGVKHVEFLSSNPWDFSDELIRVIAGHSNISRDIHLPLQSGDNTMLKKMNRWYTREEYLDLVRRIRRAVPDSRISTDIIVGFCGETEEMFENTVHIVRQVGFFKAYVAMYSDRPLTAAHRLFSDDVPHPEKKRRWLVLEEMINRRYKKT